MKIRVKHYLISCVVILARNSSSLFSRFLTLANRRLGNGGRLAQAFNLAWSPPFLPRLRRHLRSTLLGSADSLEVATGPNNDLKLRRKVKSRRLCELLMSSSACLRYVDSTQSTKRTKNKQQQQTKSQYLRAEQPNTSASRGIMTTL